MELNDTRVFVENCFHDEPASCECACPYRMEIRSFLKKMSRGRFAAAYRELSAVIPFPTLAAVLCPRPCEARCQRGCVGTDAPLNMGGLERACIAFSAGEKAQEFTLPPKAQRIAVVGAGPTGLACALALSRKKYQVTVFDRNPGWGGHLRTHPEFALFASDFEKQFSTQTVDFRFGAAVTEAELADFDAVYVAAGDPSGDFGLGGHWDPKLFTTERPGWFLGGGAANMPLMESLAAASKLSQLMEAYLQTGRASLIVEADTGDCPGHMMVHPEEPSKPGIVPADGVSYTKDEAKAEAARCMDCTCDGCMTGCELMAHYRKAPYKLASQVVGDSHTNPPFSNCEVTRQTYSCNLCGKCADLCPEGVDLGALFHFSREDRVKQKKWVPGIFDYWLRTLDFNSGEAFYASKTRCDRVFFPGCRLTAAAPNQTEAAWRFLRAQKDTGILLGCCGVPAYWAGDTERQQHNETVLRGAWEAMGRPEFVAACATCADQLRRQFPEASVRTLYEVLAEENAPKLKLPFGEAAVFDPCAARHDDLTHRSVLALAERSGCRPTELRDGGSCCGYGGHIRLANPELYKEITDHRAAESELPYIVYCANCLEVFRGKGKPVAHVLDGVFGVLDDPAPTLEQKRQNTLRLKGKIMKELEQTEFVPEAKPWDGLVLEFSPESIVNMEDKLITAGDIAETVYTAEQNGDFFVDDSGLRTACCAGKVLTFWVDYRVTAGGSFAVESAYCHRMHIGEEGAGT